MTTTAERYRTYAGPPLFAMGFRPFFFFGAVWAALAIPLWAAALLGWAPQLTRDWHVHEMLFGYLGAIVAGFLLTAVPNWTGRLPVTGAPLALLFSLWAAGRIAMLAAPADALTAWIDNLFLFALAAVIAREVIAGRNLRNLPVCALVCVLAAANLMTHVHGAGVDPVLGERIGLAVVAMLVALIGGRITPSFTRNWMAKRSMAPEPASPARFDAVVLLAVAAALAAWLFAPDAAFAGVALVCAGALTIVRLARWKGWRTFAEPLVTILHLGHLWLGAAFMLLGASVLAPALVARAAGIHALTAGAFGVMTLAVMTRATRGHTGQTLAADRITVAIYACVNLGAALRVASALMPAHYTSLLIASALVWSGAFALFAAAYGPLLLRARR